ncbi:MAG: hypothetical protein K9G58_09225 [Bacteroidales bacterium]|nr:hypothetical protein [Bacteroidales bacterium]MCF8388776.1 hypothetical protein [Bacteroidales bacterium]MCF8398337.1 hypothetical protein [Bacteroidales bacterium]
MRKQKLMIALMLIPAVLVLMKCSKDQPSINSGQSKELTELQIFKERVHHFMDLADQQRNGTQLKSGDKVSLDSAFFYLDATFNYTYCFPASTYNNMIWDTTYLEYPVDQNNEALMDDVTDAYNEAVDSIRQAYRDISDTSKKLIAVVFEALGTDASDNMQLMAIAHIGTGSSLQSMLDANGDFDPDDEYWWLRDSYKCDYSGSKGAPNIIDEELMFKYKPAPPPNKKYHYYDLETVQFEWDNYPNPDGNTDNYCDYFIYYASESVATITDETKCLDYGQTPLAIHEMDFYLDGLDDIISDWLENSNPEGKYFESVYTFSYSSSIYDLYIYHQPMLTMGKRFVVYEDEEPFPISID